MRLGVVVTAAALLAACGELTSTTGDAGAVDGGDASGGDATVDGASASDAATDTADADEGGPVGTPSLPCDTETCDPAKTVCCNGRPVTNGKGCYAGDGGDCVVDYFTCDDWIDCAHAPGTICCGVHGSDAGDLQRSRCLPEKQCRQDVSFSLVLCDPTNPRPCPGNETCTPFAGALYGCN